MADREIKFRGRDELGVWREGNLILTQGMERAKPGILLSGKVADGSYVEITYFVDEYTVSQYTGLTDANGKEIYEGDILHVDNKGYFDFYGDPVVCFGEYEYTSAIDIEDHPEAIEDDDLTCRQIFSDNPPTCNGWYCRCKTGCFPLTSENSNMFEVIGNIHDNPELLEVEK